MQEETKNYEAMHPISINTQLTETRGFYGNKIFLKEHWEEEKILLQSKHSS